MFYETIEDGCSAYASTRHAYALPERIGTDRFKAQVIACVKSKPYNIYLKIFTSKLTKKCLRMRIKVLFLAAVVHLSSHRTRDTIIFRVEQLGAASLFYLK